MYIVPSPEFHIPLLTRPHHEPPTVKSLLFDIKCDILITPQKNNKISLQYNEVILFNQVWKQHFLLKIYNEHSLAYLINMIKFQRIYGTSGIRSNILSWSSTFTALRRKQASKTLIKYSNQPHKRCSSMRRCHIKENPLTEWGISFTSIFRNVKE